MRGAEVGRVLTVATVLLAVGACSPGNASGASAARQACGGGARVPVLPGQPVSTTKTLGEVVDSYKQAQVFAAQAAARNQRWDALNDAYGTLVTFWSSVASVMGADVSSGTQATTPDQQTRVAAIRAESGAAVTAAESTIRSECAVAEIMK
jgi:hypothetical protein